MTMLALALAPAGPSLPLAPSRLAAEVLDREPALARTGFALLLLMAPTGLAQMLDERMLNGVAIWIKPLKFQLSIGVYLLTLAWFWAYRHERDRRAGRGRWLVRAAVVTALFEVGYITLQAGLGEASHYKVGDPLHAALYGLMGLAAVVLTGVSPALGLMLARRADADLAPAYRLAVVIGLVLTFCLGAATGVVLSAGDGHWIGGVRSDVGGLPLLGWSRTGGDLRAAHFLGLHALHLLPLFGVFASRVLPSRTGMAAVWCAAGLYTALAAALSAQALAGRPLL